jgi:hypothetical protein
LSWPGLCVRSLFSLCALVNACARFNYKTRVWSITGSLFPNWVMLYTSTPPGAVDLETARSTAVFRKRLVNEKQETTVVLPRVITARYIRVQLEGNDYLSIAEIEAFTERV